MQLGILVLVLVASIFGSGYWYTELNLPCKTPIHYRIGAIDPRFKTGTEELKRIAQNAEAIWETPLDTELFVYDESKGIPINLVFDERQEKADLQAELKEDLDAKEGMSESVGKQYETLIAEFRKLKKDYESRVVAYETKLASYNDVVSEWNSKGGAPPTEIAKLRETERSLTREQKTLESTTVKLNSLVTQLNAIGARGNSLITDYNSIVNEYNSQFSEVKEFTQGDYTGDAIDVYQFNSEDELTIVLAHELGHALSLDHVENEKSIMYHFMGAQRIDVGITVEDSAEFTRVCANPSFAVRVLRFFSNLV